MKYISSTKRFIIYWQSSVTLSNRCSGLADQRICNENGFYKCMQRFTVILKSLKQGLAEKKYFNEQKNEWMGVQEPEPV